MRAAVAVLVAMFPLLALAAPDDDRWEPVIEVARDAVMALRVDVVRPFDTNSYATTQATGFVVDAERGIVMTNRHVVSPGPVVAEGLFQNGEEVELEAIYRDPVHDFGFFRYDPEALRFAEPQQLTLDPSGARVGVEIRVVGNDAGEQLSILSGTLARLDRGAPSYGRGRYNDFNTFYIQAASNTSGGSSGSPVLNAYGKVVALNAGGSRAAASSFYLPLDRAQRALNLIRAGEPVPRGTLHTTVVHQPYDVLRRIGLNTATEARVREAFPEGTGMLVVDAVLPEGAADGALREGDVIVEVNGALVAAFVPLEEALDAHVGSTIDVLVERGGEALALRLPVADLHAATPSRFLEVGGAVLHDVSYQLARHYERPLRGVMVASTGYMLDRAKVPYRAVIHSIDGHAVSTLRDVNEVLQGALDGSPLRVGWTPLSDPSLERVSVVRMDRRWFPISECEMAEAGWTCGRRDGVEGVHTPEGGSTTFARERDRVARRVVPSLVALRYDVPYRIDGTPSDNYTGFGVVVDAERGLVVTDRNTVPITLGDVELTFAGALRIPGEVLLLHPTHNVALLRYDPALLGDTPVKSARWRDRDLRGGDKVRFVGLRSDERVASGRGRVDDVTTVALPEPRRPRFLERNLRVARVSGLPSDVNGVLTDKRGRLRGIWGTVSYEGGQSFLGMPTWLIDDLLTLWATGHEATLADLEVDWGRMSIADARDRGVPDAWLAKLARHDEERRVLVVGRRTTGSPAATALRQNDLLLAIDGKPVTRLRDVELAVQGQDRVRLTVSRDGDVVEAEITPRRLGALGSTRMLFWAGAFVQDVPYEVHQRGRPDVSGVYVDLRWRGSPSMRYGLGSFVRVTDVDGTPTPDLDAFIAAVAEVPHRASVRLSTVDLDGRRSVVAVKTDRVHWPTRELRWTPSGWERVEHD